MKTKMTWSKICPMIRNSGFVDIIHGNETIRVGFQGSGHATLTMLGGGYYAVTTGDGRRIAFGKGELITLA